MIKFAYRTLTDTIFEILSADFLSYAGDSTWSGSESGENHEILTV
jgi:hypothetical protein